MIRSALVVLLAPIVCSASPISLQEAASIMRPTASEGVFTEEKNIPDVPNSIVSRGRYKLGSDFLEWRTETPFETLLKLTPEGVSYGYDGETFELSSEEVPGIGAFSTLFSRALSGDFRALEEFFVLKFDKTDGVVTVEASPVDRSAYSDLQKITLKGVGSVETVLIEFSSGARTLITLGGSNAEDPS